MPETNWGQTFIQYGQEGNACNHALKDDAHTDECDGTCGKEELYASEVDLHNEVVRWNRIPAKIQGIPDVLMGGPFEGIGVDILKLQFVVQAVVQTLIEMDADLEDVIAEHQRQAMVNQLTEMREEYERAQAKDNITIARPSIIIPGKDGNGEIKH
jgi:hypothetical protein